jgi:hemin uptake protein HemP
MNRQRQDRDEVRKAPEKGAVASVSSHRLLGAEGRLLIEHRGEHYTLRLTRQGKLILTK